MKTDSAVLRVSVLAILAGVFTLLVSWDSGGLPVAHAQHLQPTSGERGGGGLPGGQNDWFTGSGLCEGCHGHDFAGYAGLDSDSVDVNVVDHWRSSMMANSAHDPFWRAKVSHEVLVNPAHQLETSARAATRRRVASIPR